MKLSIGGAEFVQLMVGNRLLEGDLVHDKDNQKFTNLDKAGVKAGFVYHAANPQHDFYRAKNPDLAWAMNTYARHGINDARMNRLMRKMIADQGYDDIHVLGHLHAPLNFWEFDVSLKTCLDPKHPFEVQIQSRINPDLQAGSNQASPARINPEQPKESTESINPVMDRIARENGLGHWKCTTEDDNGGWQRVDGKRAEYLGQGHGNVIDYLKSVDHHFPIKPIPVDAGRREGDGKEWVNHPDHYNSNPSGVEAIDVIEHMSFNLGNAVKYIWRAGDKGKFLEDLRKAAWYLNREIERVESESTRGD